MTCLPLLSLSVVHVSQCLQGPVSVQIGSVNFGKFRDLAVGGISDFRLAQDLAVGGTSDLRLAQELAVGGTADGYLVQSSGFSAFHAAAVPKQV